MKIQCKLFDLDRSLSCGQVFRWQLEEDNWWYGVVNDHLIKVRQVNDALEFEVYPEPPNASQFISNYFRFDDDLDRIYSQIAKDEVIKEAIQYARGLRLIRQDPWECMISFMISQNNQIPKIKQSLETLTRKFGRPYNYKDKEFYTFPTPERLSTVKLRELKEAFDSGGCALGYRGKYILGAALMITNQALGFVLEDLKKLSYHEASKLLQDSFCGIGPKVADCILLFSMEKLEACPLDTWIRRIIANRYFQDRKVNDRELKEFCVSYFGKYAGYAQEYLYCHRSQLCQ